MQTRTLTNWMYDLRREFPKGFVSIEVGASREGDEKIEFEWTISVMPPEAHGKSFYGSGESYESALAKVKQEMVLWGNQQDTEV